LVADPEAGDMVEGAIWFGADEGSQNELWVLVHGYGLDVICEPEKSVVILSLIDRRTALGESLHGVGVAVVAPSVYEALSAALCLWRECLLGGGTARLKKRRSLWRTQFLYVRPAHRWSTSATSRLSALIEDADRCAV
jgi:hypothetical protein